MIDPLCNLKILNPHAGPVLNLPEVTTITIDDRFDRVTIGRLSSVTLWHRRFLKPAREVIVSGSRPDVDGIDWVKIERWKSDPMSCYSIWCQKELLNHFSTPFVLVWQADGFAVNPQNWTQEFTRYDFVGSPFNFMLNAVGNGGFSLRSKQFCKAASRLPDCGSVPEDVYFCLHRRLELCRNGVRFCPVNVADKWGVDWGTKEHPLRGRFGFHGKSIFQAVYQHTASMVRDRDCGPRVLFNGARWDGRKLIRDKPVRA